MGDKLGQNEAKAMEMLLHLDALRGKHSTGVAVAKKHGAVELYKEVGPPDYLYKSFPDKFTHGRLALHDTFMVMGHNRWATQGKINAETAHPFNFNKIVGAHNGTVNIYSLRDLDGYKEYDIDSQIIYKHLDENPIQEVWDAADGALALTWYDKEEKILNFARNKERPLLYAITPDKSTIIWGSEDWFIWFACGRNNIKLGEDAVTEVEENTHYKIKMVEGKVEVDKIKLTPFKRKPVTVKTSTWTGGTGSSVAGATNVTPLYDEEFFIEEWYPLTSLKKGGKTVPGTGWFGASTIEYGEIRVIVRHIDEMAQMVIDRLNDNDMWAVWKTSKAYYQYSKKTQKWVLCVDWADVDLDYDHRTMPPRDNKVVELSPPKEGEVGYLQEYVNMFNMMIPRQTWQANVDAAGGCSQCGHPADWSERNGMQWRYHGVELVFNCPTCSGTYN
jgi:hypothetical protein